MYAVVNNTVNPDESDIIILCYTNLNAIICRQKQSVYVATSSILSKPIDNITDGMLRSVIN